MNTNTQKQDKVLDAARYYIENKGRESYTRVADKFLVDGQSLRTRVARLRVLRIA